jgi:AcrR family transcriptional regulator
MASKEKITKGYIEFELMNGRAPHSVLELTKKLKIEESEFFACFGSLEQVRREILNGMLETTLALMDADPNYHSFTAREKLLALFYSLFEQFKSRRSYLLARYSDMKNLPQISADWKDFMKKLTSRADDIVSEAKSLDEIKDRPVIANHYGKGAPLVFAYLFRVWIKDESPDFANTDAAIEKSVNTAFDVLGANPLDTLFDFGKFAFKTKVF